MSRATDQVRKLASFLPHFRCVGPFGSVLLELADAYIFLLIKILWADASLRHCN